MKPKKLIFNLLEQYPKGLTQKELAKITGLSSRSISGILSTYKKRGQLASFKKDKHLIYKLVKQPKPTMDLSIEDFFDFVQNLRNENTQLRRMGKLYQAENNQLKAKIDKLTNQLKNRCSIDFSKLLG